MSSIKINQTTVKIVRDDLTAMEVEAFAFYAKEDLSLGTGYGNAISMRGGVAIAKELKEIGSKKVTEAVITTGGLLKAKHIIHAVGPAFQEEGIQEKLKQTMTNALECANQNKITQLAFPLMGAGFYGILPDICIGIMLDSIKNHLSGKSSLKEIILCGNDNRELDFLSKNLK